MIYKYLQRVYAYTGYRGSKFFKKTPPPLRNLSSKIIIHENAEKGSYPPPVTIDGQLERATGNFWRPLDDVIKDATSTDLSHSATTLYRLDNVTLDNGFLYMGAKAEYLSSLGPPKLDKITHEKEGVLCSTSAGALYFGCWMYGDNLLEGIASELSQKAIKVMPHKNYFHLPDVNKTLNLSNQYVNQPIVFDNLYITDDGGYNKNKANRIRNLRNLYAKSSASSHESTKLVYMKRGINANSRILSNETEITQYLETCGFKIINPEDMSFGEIAAAVSGSDIIVGVEGSQLTHGLLGIKEGGYMIEFQPPYHFQATHRPRCESVGVRWGFLIGCQNDEGFEIPLDDLKKLLGDII